MSLLILLWLGCAIGAGIIASNKGRSGGGWALLGFLFGPLGLLASAMISPDHQSAANRSVKAGLQDRTLRLCPECREAVRYDARHCRFCNQPLDPLPKPGLFG